MNMQQTLQQLQQLRLTGMANRYKSIIETPVHQLPDLHTMMAMLIESEIQHRTDYRSERMLKKSKLRYDAVPQDIYCNAERGLSKEQLIKLMESSYIKKGEPVLITGSTGSGKSFLACALGRQACNLGYATRFISLSRLLEQFGAARLEGTYGKLLAQIEKIPLLILDDFGLRMLDAESSLTLKDILEDRYRRAATIVTSQLPVNKWYELFKEPTLADAVMDRLTAKAHIVELSGKSLRRE